MATRADNTSACITLSSVHALVWSRHCGLPYLYPRYLWCLNASNTRTFYYWDYYAIGSEAFLPTAEGKTDS